MHEILDSQLDARARRVYLIFSDTRYGFLPAASVTIASAVLRFEEDRNTS